MFENVIAFFKNMKKSEKNTNSSKDAAKERLHLVLMQDRANVSADFLDLMRQEIIDVIKKYIEVDENEIDVRLTNKQNTDGTTGAPALYANIPIVNIKQEAKLKEKQEAEEEKKTMEEAKQIIDKTQNKPEDVEEKKQEDSAQQNSLDEARPEEKTEKGKTKDKPKK